MRSNRWPAAVALASLLLSAAAIGATQLFDGTDEVPSAAHRAGAAGGRPAGGRLGEGPLGQRRGLPGLSRTEERTTLDARRLDGPATLGRPAVDDDTLIVRFAKGADKTAVRAAYRAAGATTVRSLVALGADVVSVPSERRDAIAERLRGEPGIAGVEANRRRYASVTPNDEGVFDQFHLFLTRVPLAWEVAKGSSSLDIAILDTGVDLDHPDLASRIVAGHDFVNSDSNAMDDNGHGTMVAGVAAAKTNNAIGVAGVAWNARIIPVKVLDVDGGGWDSDVANGIVWAVDHGAEVINLSLGAPGASPMLTSAVAYATANNVVVVAAAGNEGTSEPSYPAAIPDVVAVGATDTATDTASFTNFGPWVDLVAPGTEIVSTYLAPGPNEAYAVGDGTSFSSPLVAGVALLDKAKYPTKTSAQIASDLITKSADRGVPGIDDYFAHGFLDAYAAVGGRTATSPPMAWGDNYEPNDTRERSTPLPERTALATLAPAGDVDWFSVGWQSSGRLGVQITPPEESESFDPIVSVYGQDGGLLGTRRGTPGVFGTLTVPVDSDGSIGIRVANALATKTGQYRITMTFAPIVTQGFHEYDQYDAGFYPDVVAVGDVTGDGRNDVLVATSPSQDESWKDVLWVYPQTALGSLGPPTVYTMAQRSGIGPYGITIADIDGDGDNDVLTPSVWGLEVFRQSSGSLVGPERIEQFNDTLETAVADVFDDGDDDIVVSSGEGTSILEPSGESWTRIDVADTPMHSPHVADVTGDGRLDLVSREYARLRVLEHQADDTFVAQVYVGQVANVGNYDDITVADANDDGRMDVVGIGGANGSQQLNVYLQNTSGDLVQQPKQRIENVDLLEGIRSADVNNDGRTDIVVQAWNETAVIYQDDTGELRRDRSYSLGITSHGSHQVEVADITGDGLPDIVGLDLLNELVVLRQGGAVTLPDLSWVTNTSPADLATGVAANASATVDFVRRIDTTTVTPSTVGIVDAKTGSAVAAARTYDSFYRRITINPTANLTPGRPYLVKVTGVEDVTGAAMDEVYSFRFTVAAPAVTAPTKADINGDGYDDVIVGAPGEDIGSIKDAGVINVSYGSADGVKTTGAQMLHQNSPDVPGTAEAGDVFGAAIATGDVNNDGYDDVAVGAPGEAVGSITKAGLVHLFLGGPSGLKTAGSQGWTQDSSGVPDTAETSDRFGSALAFGDFDNSAGADLAIGSPGESVGSLAGAGAIHVLRGAAAGLVTTAVAQWTQQTVDGTAAAGNAFGASMAAGDLDGDRHDDLAVSAPLEDITETDQGSVSIFHGTIVGMRPQGVLWTELITGTEAAPGERFGTALTIGDFGGLAQADGYGDLAIGSPGAASGAGRVDMVWSDWLGVGLAVKSVEQSGFGNQPEGGDAFGFALSAGHVGTDPTTWLAIGSPGEDGGAGVVHVAAPYVWFDQAPELPTAIAQGTRGLPDTREPDDRFGEVVRVLSVDGYALPDLVVGVPKESNGSTTQVGAVFVVRNTQTYPTLQTQLLRQGSAGVVGSAEAADRFGAALGG